MLLKCDTKQRSASFKVFPMPLRDALLRDAIRNQILFIALGKSFKRKELSLN